MDDLPELEDPRAVRPTRCPLCKVGIEYPALRSENLHFVETIYECGGSYRITWENFREAHNRWEPSRRCGTRTADCTTRRAVELKDYPKKTQAKPLQPPEYDDSNPYY